MTPPRGKPAGRTVRVGLSQEVLLIPGEVTRGRRSNHRRPKIARRPVRGPGAAVEGADTERCVIPLGFGGLC